MSETETLQQGALRRLLEVSVHMASSADRQSVLRSIVDAMRDVLRAERATVFELDAERNELVATVAHGIGGPSAVGGDGGEIRLPLGTGLAGECASTRRIINVPDTDLDPRFNRDVDVQTGFRTRSILSIPLVDHDRTLVGVAQVLNKIGGSFDEDDVGVAAALASHAAVTLRRSQLIEERLHRQKLLRDLDLARAIQQGTLPSAVPQPPGYEIGAWFDPAEQTGGDSYDAIELATGPDGPPRVMLLLADATGHGIGPALCATQVRAMVRIAARLGCGLGETARHLNEQLHEDLPSGRFVTAWLGILDATTHELLHFSAGQGPLLHYVAAEGCVSVSEPDAPPLGVLPDIAAGPRAPLVLERGDLFIVTSDGILEARDRRGECFGAERFGDLVRGLADRPVTEIIAGLREQLEMHLGEGRPDDDVTLLVIKRRL